MSRLTPPGIAATAAPSQLDWTRHPSSASRPPESRRLRPCAVVNPTRDCPPPHAPRNRGDCGSAVIGLATGRRSRLTPPGIAATAASDGYEPRRAALRRLTPPGIAATAALSTRQASTAVVRLTPPGIAATAASRVTTRLDASIPPHAPRNRGDCGFGRRLGGLQWARPPHAPRNRGDCGVASGCNRRLIDSASRPPESRRLRLPRLNPLRSRRRVADLRAQEQVSRRSPLRWGWTITFLPV